ncbi:MAG: AbrB/MazE/SpoVT family DNA-binding domain-containing protein [Acidobacteria bacterium]|nr:MAG: AbrB/MazE/SpoVT family DNA-binding domain-containing protein [Acidobacteriota bacterium]RPJ76086.1 MAG: AbrB/MazE/SpoVT family DNA-binding domain-containing protein [Acidobacteriota bacterium]
MTLTSKGQVTIPQEIREKLGLLPGTRVVFDVVGDSVRIRKAAEQRRGSELIERMRAAGRRAGRPRLTTDQIMALTRGE